MCFYGVFGKINIKFCCFEWENVNFEYSSSKHNIFDIAQKRGVTIKGSASIRGNTIQ